METKEIIFNLIIAFIMLPLLSCGTQIKREIIKDKAYPFPAGAVKMDGYFDEYIQNSIENWNKGDLPYGWFVDFFRNCRPKFALGDMWKKLYVRYVCFIDTHKILN